MADGEGCKCAAYSESECACDADWTPQELIDARAEIERRRLTDEEREAVERAISLVMDAEYYGGDEPPRVAALRGLLERLT